MAHIPIWTNIAADYITWEARRQKIGGGNGGEKEGPGGRGRKVGEPTVPLSQRIMSS